MDGKEQRLVGALRVSVMSSLMTAARSCLIATRLTSAENLSWSYANSLAWWSQARRHCQVKREGGGKIRLGWESLQ